jgi:hypothetical protein
MKARRFLAVVLAVTVLLFGLGAGAWWLVWQRSPLQLQHRRLALPRAARFVPRDAAFSFYLLSDPEAPLAYARAVAPASRRRQAGDTLARLRDGAFAAAGLDYDGELADWLGSDTAVWLLADGQAAPAGWVLALASRDGDGARRFLQRFWQTRSLAGTELQISSYRGMGLISGRGALRGQEPLPLATALIDDDLVLLASGRGALEQALDVSQIDELNQAADPRLVERLSRLGDGVALLTGRLEALQTWLAQPLPAGGALVAALRPEGRELVLDGWLQTVTAAAEPLPSLPGAADEGEALLEALHGEADSIALLRNPAQWPEPWRQALLQLQRIGAADAPLPALLLQQAPGVLLWREGADGRLLGTRPAPGDPAGLAPSLLQQGLVAAPLEFDGHPVEVWTRLRVGAAGGRLEATLAAARSEQDGWAWWSDSLEALGRQQRGRGQPRALRARFEALAMPEAALRWAGVGERAQALLQHWAGWRLLSALAGQPLAETVQAVALAVEPESLPKSLPKSLQESQPQPGLLSDLQSDLLSDPLSELQSDPQSDPQSELRSPLRAQALRLRLRLAFGA